MMKKLFTLVAALCLATSAHAQLSVSNPWIRATVPQQKATGAFMQISSAKDSRLVQVSSPAAGIVEIHQMEMVDQMMRMRPVDGIDLPAGKSVNLASGGYHIMLMDLKKQLKAGDSVPVVLTIEGKNKKRENVTVNAVVNPINYTSPPAAGAASAQQH
jgi:copper(I)-binding protein